ncbi:MAG: oligosaccharide flippase family protein [Bacillus sp. (in: firmicutes)]
MILEWVEMKEINQEQNVSKKFLQGAFILTISTVFIKLLSAFYRIPYQNIVGDVGFYIYQQVYPFYSFVLVLSTYGFPVIISKLLAEVREERKSFTRTDILVTSWISLSAIGLIMFCCLYFGAGFLADIMSDQMLAKSIRLISFAFLFLPIVSIFKGIFQSEGDMFPTACAQVVEQTVRVSFILTFAFFFYQYGLSLYEVAEGAFLGSVAGALVSCIILLFFYRKKQNKTIVTIDSIHLRKKFIPLSKKIIGQGILFCISSLILVFIQFMDALVLYPLLMTSGLEMTEAKQWKGIYDRGQPLLQVGTAAIMSLSLTVVPLISEFHEKRDQKQVEYYTELSFRLCIMLGMAATVGLFWIIEPTNYMLFTDWKGSSALSVLVLSIFFCSILMTGMFILQSLGRSLTSLMIIGVGLIVKFLCMIIWVPKWNIMGAAVSTTAAFMVMAGLLFIYLRRVMKKMVVKAGMLKLTIFASASMSIVLLVEAILFRLISDMETASRLVVACQVIFSVVTGAVTYMFIIIRGGMFTAEELQLLPGGSKLSKLLRKNK